MPESFVRMRLPPGDHVLRASWPEGGETQMAFREAAGEIRVIELAGSAWAWGSTYAFRPGVRETEAMCCGVRMVADID